MRLRNIFEGVPLDRLGHNRKNETWVADQLASPAARVVPVWRASNLISQPSEDSAEGGAEIAGSPYQERQHGGEGRVSKACSTPS